MESFWRKNTINQMNLNQIQYMPYDFHPWKLNDKTYFKSECKMFF